MTTPLIFGRPLPGVVGETRRVVHVFETPAEDTMPERLTALCADSFGPGELELLDRPSGMPCVLCLTLTPNTAPDLPDDARRVLPSGTDGGAT